MNKNLEDFYEGFWKVDMVCYIPTTDNGSQEKQLLEYLKDNPKFAAGYMEDIKIEFVKRDDSN